MEQLYHIHVSNSHDDQFYEGNIIIVGKEFNNFRQDFLRRSATYLDRSEMGEDGKSHDYYRDLENVLSLDKFKGLNVAQQLRVLEAVRAYVINSKLDFREIILEDVRKLLHPAYPSRYNCIWLTDKDSLPFWEQQLKADKRGAQIFEVEYDGNLFLSTNTLLPDSYIPRDIMYQEAKKYWEPSFEDLVKNDDREYLFTGELKLTKRVK